MKHLAMSFLELYYELSFIGEDYKRLGAHLDARRAVLEPID